MGKIGLSVAVSSRKWRCRRKGPSFSRHEQCVAPRCHPLPPPSLPTCCQCRTAFARNLAALAHFPLDLLATTLHTPPVEHDHTNSLAPPALMPQLSASAESRVPQTLPFNPPSNSIPAILDSLASSCLSLLQIAHAHNTTLDALTTWMTRPDIAERLDELHLLAAQRARLVAAQHLAAAAEALASIVHTGMSRAESASLDPTNPRHLALRLRQRESIRRAATTILRISTYSPRPAWQRPVGRTSCPPTVPPVPRLSGSAESRVLPTANPAPLPPHIPLHSQPCIPLRNAEGVAASSQPGEVPSPSVTSPSPHAEGVQVSSRWSPRSGTPGTPAPVDSSFTRGAQRPEGEPGALPPLPATSTAARCDPTQGSLSVGVASRRPTATHCRGYAALPVPRLSAPAESRVPEALTLLTAAGALSPLARHNRAPP